MPIYLEQRVKNDMSCLFEILAWTSELARHDTYIIPLRFLYHNTRHKTLHYSRLTFRVKMPQNTPPRPYLRVGRRHVKRITVWLLSEKVGVWFVCLSEFDTLERGRGFDSVYDCVWAQCGEWSDLDSPNMEPITGISLIPWQLKRSFVRYLDVWTDRHSYFYDSIHSGFGARNRNNYLEAFLHTIISMFFHMSCR